MANRRSRKGKTKGMREGDDEPRPASFMNGFHAKLEEIYDESREKAEKLADEAASMADRELARELKKRSVIKILGSGGSVADAAKMAGLKQWEVSNWMRDPVFKEAVKAEAAWLHEEIRQDLIGTLALASGAVRDQIANGDGNLAFRLLERWGLVPGPPPAQEPKKAEERKSPHIMLPGEQTVEEWNQGNGKKPN